MTVEEAKTVLYLKKLYTDRLCRKGFEEEKLYKEIYPQDDLHHVYIYEILKVYEGGRKSLFEKKTRNGVPFFTSTILPIPHAFSTRLGGVSSLPHLQSMNLGENRGDEPQNVQKNFDLLCQASGLPRKVVSGLQIHSEKLLYAEDSFEEKPSCDGFYTDRAGSFPLREGGGLSAGAAL